MKTTWSLDYLHREMSPRQVHQWKLRKLDELEADTGVRWESWHEHGRQVFQPTWRGLAPLEDEDAGQAILDALYALRQPTWGMTFTEAAEATGLPLLDVARVSRWLVATCRARVMCGRMAESCGIAALRKEAPDA